MLFAPPSIKISGYASASEVKHGWQEATGHSNTLRAWRAVPALEVPKAHNFQTGSCTLLLGGLRLT